MVSHLEVTGKIMYLHFNLLLRSFNIKIVISKASVVLKLSKNIQSLHNDAHHKTERTPLEILTNCQCQPNPIFYTTRILGKKSNLSQKSKAFVKSINLMFDS